MSKLDEFLRMHAVVVQGVMTIAFLEWAAAQKTNMTAPYVLQTAWNAWQAAHAQQRADDELCLTAIFVDYKSMVPAATLKLEGAQHMLDAFKRT